MLPRATKLNPEFTFAGFTFPRYLAHLSSASLGRRLELRKFAGGAGGYFNSPTPNNHDGIGFYLESDKGSPFALRWQWADEVADVRIDHTGWFCDEYQDTKIRGVVFRLPNNRGFLAGHSMGEHMSSSVDFHVYDSERDATYAADSMAECVAEEEVEYQEQYKEDEDAENDE